MVHPYGYGKISGFLCQRSMRFKLLFVVVIIEIQKVSELLDVDTNWWKTELVNNTFNEDEARLICGMAVCPRNRQDKLVWTSTKNRKFSVRSAYHLAKECSL
jgi:hypothetical protein